MIIWSAVQSIVHLVQDQECWCWIVLRHSPRLSPPPSSGASVMDVCLYCCVPSQPSPQHRTFFLSLKPFLKQLSVLKIVRQFYLLLATPHYSLTVTINNYGQLMAILIVPRGHIWSWTFQVRWTVIRRRDDESCHQFPSPPLLQEFLWEHDIQHNSF